MNLKDAIHDRILILDGAMGSMIQAENLTEDDFRGERWRESGTLLKGNNDLLTLTRPDIIRKIHRQYLEAGADIIETNTFGAQRITQSEYHTEEAVREMNFAAARLAREEADRMTALTPAKPRFVVGSVGPTGKMLSMSEDADNPASRAITFDALQRAYLEQMEALVAGGVDGILVETIFDTLNAKAAIAAYREVQGSRFKVLTPQGGPAAKPEQGAGFKRDGSLELMLSMTVSDASGRTLSGQTIEAFVTSVAHAEPLSVGLNCGLGAKDMLPWLRQMAEAAPSTYISCHPNAGLPNEWGKYEDSPEKMQGEIQTMVNDGLVNVVGGCCGTTPAHIAAMRRIAESAPVHLISRAEQPQMRLSGLERTAPSETTFVNVGERCNVAGSKKFLRLIGEKNYEEALAIARKQVDDGAMVIDVNMDDGLLDGVSEMTTFLNLLMSDPAIARVPVMIDSSRWEVISAGLKCVQGKSIVNSISLKEGEEKFLDHAREIRKMGAAVVVMCFDEQGQATCYDRKIEIAARAYRLLTEKVKFPPEDIIFDPNVLTIATGMKEHDRYGLDFIEATAWIRKNLPGARVSGGLSNLSFSFRGNNYLREAMHAVFLYHAIAEGMGMAIMNPSAKVQYDDIEPELRELLEDVILCRRDDAAERLIDYSTRNKEQAANGKAQTVEDPRKGLTIAEKLKKALTEGDASHMEEDIPAAIAEFGTPLAIIAGPLMEGMNHVGNLFGEGKMFLPQVVKTARTMKKAVELLNPYMESAGTAEKVSSLKNGKIVIATVKGDVHDIGKNIVAVVLVCNNWDVIDLGVMVPTGKIVETAIREKADFVCLSGLITPSLDEMCHVAEAMERAGLRIPIMVGGATTSPLHTAVKIAPLYSGPVFHVKDAAMNPVICQRLMDAATRDAFIEENRRQQEELRSRHATVEKPEEEGDAVTSGKPGRPGSRIEPAIPPFTGRRLHAPIHIKELIPLIDWHPFFWTWRVKADSEEGRKLKADATDWLERHADDEAYAMRAALAFYAAVSDGKGIRVKTSASGHPADCSCCSRTVYLQTARQTNGERLSLCDFVSSEPGDHIGVFACTVSRQFIDELETLKQGSDDYASLLMQSIGDRLAEAGSEYMHRETGWPGIRPAVGYPSWPDLREIFKLRDLIGFEDLGIRITENGAMYPQASVCGIYIGHPNARYFNT